MWEWGIRFKVTLPHSDGEVGGSRQFLGQQFMAGWGGDQGAKSKDGFEGWDGKMRTGHESGFGNRNTCQAWSGVQRRSPPSETQASRAQMLLELCATLESTRVKKRLLCSHRKGDTSKENGSRVFRKMIALSHLCWCRMLFQEGRKPGNPGSQEDYEFQTSLCCRTNLSPSSAM